MALQVLFYFIVKYQNSYKCPASRQLQKKIRKQKNKQTNNYNNNLCQYWLLKKNYQKGEEDNKECAHVKEKEQKKKIKK